jgi:hypothetical protein
MMLVRPDKYSDQVFLQDLQEEYMDSSGSTGQ